MLEKCVSNAQKNLSQRTTKPSKIAPTGTASFLWNAMEQKDIVDGGTGVSTSHRCSASNKNQPQNKR